MRPVDHTHPSLPGWVIRSYSNGIFDAAQTDGPAVSPGFATFGEAVAWVLSQEGEHPDWWA